MNKHRKKCEQLKEIRKNVADTLGVELNQTVCTYERDCKGTCPKCRQEEQKLSKALLAGTAVAAGAALLLTGCGTEKIDLELEGALELNQPDEIVTEFITGEEQLDGDVVYVPENEE